MRESWLGGSWSFTIRASGQVPGGPPWRFRSYFWLSLSLRVLGQPTLSSRSVLQSQDGQLWSRLTSPAVSAGSGCLAKRCAASDPNLHPGQLVRGAALELEAAGRLAI